MILKNIKFCSYILLLFLLSCKSANLSNKKSDNDIYYKVFCELENENNLFNELYKEHLTKGFTLCSVTDAQKTVYKNHPKAFLKVLASDFDNNNFLKVKNLNIFSVLSKEEKQEYGDLCIGIEELVFENSKGAFSVFNSLKDYKSKEIHFNTINWIWLIQQNSIYRISSPNHSVTSSEMETIKNHFETLLKRKGEVYTLSFYE